MSLIWVMLSFKQHISHFRMILKYFQMKKCVWTGLLGNLRLTVGSSHQWAHHISEHSLILTTAFLPSVCSHTTPLSSLCVSAVPAHEKCFFQAVLGIGVGMQSAEKKNSDGGHLVLTFSVITFAVTWGTQAICWDKRDKAASAFKRRTNEQWASASLRAWTEYENCEMTQQS